MVVMLGKGISLCLSERLILKFDNHHVNYTLRGLDATFCIIKSCLMHILESICVTYIYVSLHNGNFIATIIACMHVLKIIDSQGVF